MASIEDRSVTASNRTDTFRVVWREDGRKKTETFTTRRQAEQFKTWVEASGNRCPPGWKLGVGRVERPLFTDVVEAWLADAADYRGVDPDTIRDYRRLIGREWTPRWGHLAVEDVTELDCETWQDEYAAERAFKTVQNARGILIPLFRFAVYKGWIPVSPMDRVRPPRKPRGERGSVTGIHYFTDETYQAIRSHLCPTATDLCDVAVLTGARWSEYTALRVSDCHLAGETPSITVLRSFSRGRRRVKAVKTDNGFRTIYLSPAARELLLRLTNGRSRDEYVLVNREGNPHKNSAFHRYHWHNAVAAARADGWALGDRAQIKSLRHTYAVQMLTAGMPVTVLQRQLGHASLQMTNDRYGGIVDVERGRQAWLFGETLDRLLP